MESERREQSDTEHVSQNVYLNNESKLYGLIIAYCTALLI